MKIIRNFQNFNFQSTFKKRKGVGKLCDFAHKTCDIAQKNAPPKNVISLIINKMTFWHTFCSIINI